MRPHMEPYGVYDDPGFSLYGERDYREEALPNLACYLSIPVILLAIASCRRPFGGPFGIRHLRVYCHWAWPDLASPAYTFGTRVSVTTTFGPCGALSPLSYPPSSSSRFWA